MSYEPFVEGGGLPVDIWARTVDQGVSGPGRVGGGARGPTGSIYTVSPPWEVKPPQGVDFKLDATLTGRNLANSPSTFPVSVQFPPGSVGVIKGVSLLANALLTTSDIRWSIRFNQNPVSGWNNLTINPRAAGSLASSYSAEEVYIISPENSLLDVVVRVNDAGTYQVSVALSGWFFPAGLLSQALGAY